MLIQSPGQKHQRFCGHFGVRHEQIEPLGNHRVHVAQEICISQDLAWVLIFRQFDRDHPSMRVIAYGQN